MGIFDFLKKKKQEDVVIKFSEIEDWMTKYLEDQNLDTKIKSFKNKIIEKITKTKEYLDKLESASLLNENIPERAKQIMKGNRQNYVRKVNLFLEEIKIPKDYLEINDFSKKLTEKIDSLSKETQKSYFILKEFLNQELSEVVKTIKEMENLSLDLSEDLEKNKILVLEKIKDRLKEFENFKLSLAGLKEDKRKKEEELVELQNKKRSIERKISDMKTSSGYKEYKTLNEDIDSTEKSIQKQTKEIIAHFSTLEKAFKKYKRLSLNENLIDKYLEDPAKALLKDEKLEILEQLSNMLKSISKLELKDAKEKKTKEEIKKLNKEFLEKTRHNLNLLEEDRKKTKAKLLSNTSVMKISEQKSWLDNTSKNVEEKEAEVEDVENHIDRTNPNLIKQQVKDLLKEFSVTMNG